MNLSRIMTAERAAPAQQVSIWSKRSNEFEETGDLQRNGELASFPRQSSAA